MFFAFVHTCGRWCTQHVQRSVQASLAAPPRVCKPGALADPPLFCPCWFCCVQLLLGYLPPDPSEWDEVLARKRTEYFLFCEVRLRG